MNLRNIERNIIVGTRFLTMLAVIGSLVGSLLMFILGLHNIYQALRYWIPSETEETAEHLHQVPPEAASVISVIEALDRFLIAIVLLYFSYGVYSLFFRPEEPKPNLALPAWLRVKQIGQLKQVVAEVIIVVLFVLFLRVALQAFQNPNVSMSWQQIARLLVLPVSTTLLALALRLVNLHPKSAPSDLVEDTKPPSSKSLETRRASAPNSRE